MMGFDLVVVRIRKGRLVHQARALLSFHIIIFLSVHVCLIIIYLRWQLYCARSCCNYIYYPSTQILSLVYYCKIRNVIFMQSEAWVANGTCCQQGA